MSWWNSSNLTSFASQALKNAQKKIDKVLEISHEEAAQDDTSSAGDKKEEQKSPSQNQAVSDGDNFWSAWLGDTSETSPKSDAKTEHSTVEPLAKLLPTGLKSESICSTIQDVSQPDAEVQGTGSLQMSTSSQSELMSVELEAVLTENIPENIFETKKLRVVTESKSENKPKKGALKLSTRLAKGKKEDKDEQESKWKAEEKRRAADVEAQLKALELEAEKTLSPGVGQQAVPTMTILSYADNDVIDTTSIVTESLSVVTDSSSAVLETSWTVTESSSIKQCPLTVTETLVTDSQTENIQEASQFDKLGTTDRLSLTDMVGSVSEGWSEEGWADDGQLEDLLQTSIIKQLDKDLLMTSVNSESSIQDTSEKVEPDVKESGESAERQQTAVTDADQNRAENTTVEYVDSQFPVDTENAISLPSEDRTNEPKSDLESDIIPAEKDVAILPDARLAVSIQNEAQGEISNSESECEITKSKTESTDIRVTLASAQENTDSVPLEPTEIVAEKNQIAELKETIAISDMDKGTSNEAEMQNITELGTGSPDSSSDSVERLTESSSQRTSDSIEVLSPDSDTQIVQDSGEPVKTSSASQFVIEMCQLKDSVTSTTASDELSDSNRTLTAEDSGDNSEKDEGDADSDMKAEIKTEKETIKADKNDMISSTVSSSSSLVKNMLEDAMVESVKDMDSHSSASTEKSSEMVRIESGHNSGHTSGDEMETTTSSDIEIISTPNSNGEYRLERPFEFSPLRHALTRTVRHVSPPGHKRSDSSSSGHSNWSKNGDELLSPEGGIGLVEHWPQVKEEGTLGDEDLANDPLQTDKLLKKLADMAEILEAREKKLFEVSRDNVDLQEANNILRQQLQQSEEAREVEMSDLTTLTEEFTKRLSEAEKKYNSLARERDALKRQLKDAETILAKRSDSSAAIEKLMKEKDQQISELLAEGEKLSKQQLQSNNIIKKLRTKEKENDSLIKSQKQKIETESTELEHLRKVLDAKEDLEKKQIEAINQLNNHVKKQESENNRLKSDLEDFQEKVRSMQVTLDNSYKEIAELHKKSVTKASEAQEARLSVELAAKEELRLTLERQQQQARQDNDAMITQIEDLRLSLSRMEKEQGRREDVLRQEIADLQQRLQEAEGRNQELTEGVTAATRPLLRQIENLQSTYAAQSSSFEKVEKNLLDRLADVQSQLAMAQEKERSASEKLMEVSLRTSSLESQVAALRQEKSRLSAQLEMERTKVEVMEDSRSSELAQVERAKAALEKEISDLRKEHILLENQLEMEKMKTETERKKLQFAHDTIKEKELQLQLQVSLRASPDAGLVRRSSHATLSREGSVHENMADSMLSQEDVLDKSFTILSPNSSKMTLYETLRQTGAATLVENLQSQLKLREGEIAQLQSEIGELERTRESMARELVNLSSQIEELTSQVAEYSELKTRFSDLDNRYNALLMMYGEKVEETEELRLDLQDVKDMYKAQIEELVNKG